MFDTIRFKIPIDPLVFLSCGNSPASITVSDNSKNVKYYKGLIHLPSSNKDINFLVTDDLLFLEFSLPKALHGNNIQSINQQQAIDTVETVYRALQEVAGRTLPLPADWLLQRLDLSWNWFTHSEKEAQYILDTLKKISVPKKRRVTFDTSFSDVGSWFTTKFYLKHPEFYKNDYPSLAAQNFKKAYALLNLSEGCLRFEVELRKPQLIKEFGDDLKWGVVKEKLSITMNILRDYFGRYTSTKEITIKNIEQVSQILESKYGERTTKQLVSFLLYPKAYLSPNTRLKYKRLLKEANITQIGKKQINLKIEERTPTKIAVNKNPAEDITV